MGQLKIKWPNWLPFQNWRIVSTVEAADDIPDKLPRNGAVLVGTLANPKWLAFDCPCRTGHRILITLDAKQRQHWSVVNSQKLSVRPSVDFHTKTKRCHFFIRNGKIIWAQLRN